MADKNQIASGIVNSGAPRAGDPKVGPATPQVVHDMLQHRYEEDKNYRTAHPILPNVPLTSDNPHRELRRGPEGKTIMQSVDSAVRGK